MKLLRIVPLALVLAIVAATPVFTASDATLAADPEKPKFELNGPKVMLERWESVFAEGGKVGSKHTTVTQYKVAAETFYLFEEIYEAQFGTEKISITRRAQTDNAYMLRAFHYVADTADYTVENYAVPADDGKSDSTFFKHSVTDKAAGKVVKELRKTESMPRSLPQFAAADVFCLDYRMRMVPSGQIVVYDLGLMKDTSMRYEYKPADKIKLDGKDQTLAELVFQGGEGLDVSYYVEDYQDKASVNEIKFIRYRSLPVATNTASKSAAQSKSGADGDFLADTHLSGNAYKDEDRGIVFTRPSAAWLLQRRDITSNVTLITFNDMVGMQAAYCVAITHIPSGGLLPDQIEVCMRRLIKYISQGALQFPAPGPSTGLGPLTLYEKSDKMPSDFTGRIGRYYCLQGNGRAVGIVMISPGHLVESQKTLTRTFLESWVLAKILLPTPPKTSFVFPGDFIRIDGYHPSWVVAKNAAGDGVDIANDVMGIVGNIGGGAQPPKGTSLNKIVTQNVQGIPRPKQDDVKFDAKVGKLSAIEITSYGETGDGKMCYKVYVILGQRGVDKYMYRVEFKIPMDVQSSAMTQIEDFMSKIVFKMN